MNRKKNFEIRQSPKDLKYNSPYVGKLINKVMMGGKKSLAMSIVYAVLAKLEKTLESENGSELLGAALEVVKPTVYLRSKRIASRVYHVPIGISEDRAIKKAILWIVKGARKRKDHKFEQKLYYELLEILKDKKGESMKIKENYHRVAKDNEAFMHYV